MLDETVMSDEFFPQADEFVQNGRDDPAAHREALDHLFSVTYEELRRLASAVRRRDRASTVSPTTLVNEAWLKLIRTPGVAQTSELHFKRIAARAMRQVLVSAARRRCASKRNPDQAMRVTLDESLIPGASRDEELIALDQALDDLGKMSPRQALVVESRFFGGLESAGIAALLGVSEATVLRDWRSARAWLAGRLRQAARMGEKAIGQ
jgi:RNA polymerase sigma factor (TIGR02999 family)